MMTVESTKMIKIFYCYARKDKVLRNELESHLEPLRRSGQITTWYDREILPGAEWKREIETHLNTSDIILLLVSSNFMRSDYCYGIEMQRALEKHKTGESHIIPIILRPVNWEDAPIGALQALPSGGRAITSWRNRDEAFRDVAKGISDVVTTLLFQAQKTKKYWIDECRTSWKTEHYERALVAIEKVIHFDLNDAHFHAAKSMILWRLESYKAALIAIEDALRLDSTNVEFYEGKIAFLAHFQHYDEGLSTCEQLLQLEPQKADFYLYKSWFLFQLECYHKAQATCEHAIRLDPDNPTFHHFLKLISYVLGIPEQKGKPLEGLRVVMRVTSSYLDGMEM